MIYGICDDHEEALYLMKEALEEHISHVDEIFIFSDVNRLLAHMSKQKIDVLFLDILLGKASGIDIAVKLNTISVCTQIVFISSYASDFLEDVYVAEHIGFLKKPFNFEKLSVVLDKAKRSILNNYISLRSGNKTVFIEPALISYIEAKSHQTEFCDCNGKAVKTKSTLSELETELPDSTFLRCHRSYIVNVKQITHYTRCSISVKGYELSIPIGRKYRNQTIEQLSKCWAKSIL